MKKFDPNNPPEAPSVAKVISNLKKKEKAKQELKEIYHPHLTRASKIAEKISKFRLQNKKVLRGQNKVTVVENQPVYSRDKSRFFKAAWEEERRQLFFK